MKLGTKEVVYDEGYTRFGAAVHIMYGDSGVEPASRSSNTPASTRLVYLFTFRESLCR